MIDLTPVFPRMQRSYDPTQIL